MNSSHDRRSRTTPAPSTDAHNPVTPSVPRQADPRHGMSNADRQSFLTGSIRRPLSPYLMSGAPVSNSIVYQYLSGQTMANIFEPEAIVADASNTDSIPPQKESSREVIEFEEDVIVGSAYVNNPGELTNEIDEPAEEIIFETPLVVTADARGDAEVEADVEEKVDSELESETGFETKLDSGVLPTKPKALGDAATTAVSDSSKSDKGDHDEEKLEPPTKNDQRESDTKKMISVNKMPAQSGLDKGKRTVGGGGAAPKGGLGDAALDAWKSASSAAVATNPDAELPAGDQAVGSVTEKAATTLADRQANRPDYDAQVKAERKPMPEQPEKDSVLDTSEAEAAVKKVQELSAKRLTPKSFSSIGDPPRYEGLNPRDYVPKTVLDSVKDLEEALADPKLSATKRADLTKQLNAAKKQIAAIEEAGAKGTPSTPAPTVTDEGASSLKPPPPAQVDIMGDAIARAITSIEGRGEKIGAAAAQPLDGGKGMPELKTLATSKVKPIESEMRKELEGIAAAAGVTGDQLKTKIDEQKKTAQDKQNQNDDAVKTAATDGAKKISDDGKSDLTSIAAAKTNADNEVRDAQEAVKGPPDTEAIEQKRDEMLEKVKGAGSEVMAAYRSALIKFNTKIDDAAKQQKSDIQAASSNQRAAIRRHWSNDPDKGTVEGLPTHNWETKRITHVDTESARFKREAKTEHDTFVSVLDIELSTARNSVRDWAAHQDGRERSWWEKLWDSIVDWCTQEIANNDAWEKQRNADSRDAMAGDLDTLSKLREAQLKGNFEELNEQLNRLDADQRTLAIAYLKGNGVDSIGFVAESTMLRIMKRRTSEMTKELQEEVLADWDWTQLGRLARLTNSDFQPKVIAATIKGSIAGWGTNEDKLFAALGTARGPFERAAVEKCYQTTYGISMAEDVDDDVDGTEWRRAEALMKGDDVAIAVTTIKDAVDGAGTNEQAIKDALRGKTPAQLEEIKRLYLEKHGVELSVDLKDDLSGEELDNALALAEGDVETADAADLADAMLGPGTNEEKIQGVYDKIRQEVEAEAKASGMTAAEMRAQIKLRNEAVTRAYEKKYGRSLTEDFKDDLGGSDLTLAESLRNGDATAIDAAKAQVEKDSLIYASDDRLEDIVRNQRKQAETEVGLDNGAKFARLREQVQSGDLSAEDYKKQFEELKKQDTPENKEKQIEAQAKSKIGSLKSKYGEITGQGVEAFDRMIRDNTQGYSEDEITKLIESGGKLADEDEIYYAIAGAGTDEAKIKETLKGKTLTQIEKIRYAYEDKHGKGSFNDDILGDLSGREDLDTKLVLEMGDPSTFLEQLAGAKSPEERKKILANIEKYLTKRKEFEETGSMGRLLSGPLDQMNTVEQMQEALKAAKAYDAALEHPDSDEAKAAKEVFDMQFAGAVEAQEQHREQIDSYADIVTQVGAAVVGVVVTAATFGTAGFVIAAMYGAAAAAAASMALKADLRGAAYSWEEAGVDVVVGAVDVLAAGAGARFLGPALSSLDDVVMSVAARMGVEKAVAKKIVQEALKEAVQNGLEALPSTLVQAGMDDKIWASVDPLGNFMKVSATAAAMSAGIAVGVSGLQGIAGKVMPPKADVDVDTDIGVDTDVKADVDVKVDIDAPMTHTDIPAANLPDPKLIDLPADVDPNIAAKPAPEVPVPSSVTDPDVTKKMQQPDFDDVPTQKIERPNFDEAPTQEIKQSTKEPIEDWGDWLPSETVMQSGNPKSAADAQIMYDNSILADPGREAAIYRNSETGEYIIIQGEETNIHVGGEAPQANKPQAWKEILDGRSDSGSWELQAHSHPDLTPSNVAAANQWPSGANGDMGVMYAESIASGGARSSRIDYNINGKREFTDFGVEPGHDKPFWVNKPDGKGGRELHRFKSLEAFHEHMDMKVGADQGSVPPDMSTKQLKDLAETTKPIETKPKTPSAAGEDVPTSTTDIGAEPKTAGEPEIDTTLTDTQRTAQQRAQQDVERLRQEKRHLEETIEERRALVNEMNKAVMEKKRLMAAIDQAPDKATRDALRQQALAARNRELAASQKLEAYASEGEYQKDVRKVEERLARQEVIADPEGHRAALPCFAPDTLVRTPTGHKEIYKLRTGDLVYSWDFSRNELTLSEVVQVHRNRSNHFYEIISEDQRIEVTAQHPFWLPNTKQWLQAKFVQPGMQFMGLDGRSVEVQHISYKEYDGETTSYNLSISTETRNYFVGVGLLAHNDPIDIGLKGPHVIYIGTNPNPKFAGFVYIGQTNDLRGRGRKHRAENKIAYEQLQRRVDAGETLTTKELAQLRFHEFMKDVELEPIITGIGNTDQASYLEQRNVDIERARRGSTVEGEDFVMNRREQLNRSREDVTQRVMTDPVVQQAGFCLR